MRKLCFGFAATAAMVCAAGSAVADGMPTYGKAPYRPAITWTGCYVGVGGGYGMYNLDTHLTSAATGLPTSVTLDQGGRGWFGTAQVGCDYQFSGKWLAGAFIDGLGGHHGKAYRSEHRQCRPCQRRYAVERVLGGGGRLGYLVNPCF
jgi:outer membrane immunogenic protein